MLAFYKMDEIKNSLLKCELFLQSNLEKLHKIVD